MTEPSTRLVSAEIRALAECVASTRSFGRPGDAVEIDLRDIEEAKMLLAEFVARGLELRCVRRE